MLHYRKILPVRERISCIVAKPYFYHIRLSVKQQVLKKHENILKSKHVTLIDRDLSIDEIDRILRTSGKV